MSALTVRMLEEIARFEVGSPPGTPIEVRELVNQAGEALVAAFPWKWLEGRMAALRPRASISLSGATWTESTKTLALTAAFADYSFLSADGVSILSGAGATVGTNEIASKTDANSIVLATSIGSAADGQTDIEALLPNDQIALPSDFDMQSITAWGMSNGLVGMLEPTGAQTIIDLRSFPGLGTTVGFWALLRYVRTVGVQPIPRLELWPRSGSSDEALVIAYRGGWREPATDDEVLSIPNWCNTLFVEMFKAVVMGHEEPEGGTISQRLTALRQGVVWLDAVKRDAMTQPELGPIENGWMGDYDRRVGRYDVPMAPITP